MGLTVGIIGGGQLGRMLTEAAKPLGINIVVIDPSKNSPAHQAGAAEITAPLQDKQAIHELARRCDVITVEIEHLNASALHELESLGKPVHPSAETIELIQDKLTQNNFLQKAGLPIAEFRQINNETDAKQAFDDFGKYVLKSRFGGFDGRGNAVISTAADIKPALQKLGEVPKYAEQFVPFKNELAIMVARSRHGKLTSYPVVETVHHNSICHLVMAPADISAAIAISADKLAKAAVAKLSGAGMYGVEMFLTTDNELLINEIAPRVHNSGHYTIEACATSQFEQHIRLVSDMPPGKTNIKVPAAVMINILGERNGPVQLAGVEEIANMKNVYLHLYGKSPTKVDRKMGHITAVADTIKSARKMAEQARKLISI